MGVDLTEEVRTRINDELRIPQNLGLADNLLTLKDIVDAVKRDLNALPEPFDRNLSGCLVASCLGIVTSNPLEKDLLMPIADYVTPLQVSLRYDNNVRNEVVN